MTERIREWVVGEGVYIERVDGRPLPPETKERLREHVSRLVPHLPYDVDSSNHYFQVLFTLENLEKFGGRTELKEQVEEAISDLLPKLGVWTLQTKKVVTIRLVENGDHSSSP